MALNLFDNYLSNRNQVVKILNDFSRPLTIKRGVPQGTVLGPVMFLIFINDIGKVLGSGKTISYADDTVVVFQGMNWHDVTNSAVDGMAQINTWLRKNGLLLNMDKTKFIKFSLKSNDELSKIKVHLECESKNDCSCPDIVETKVIKYLGVFIDSALRWNKHASYLQRQLKYISYRFYLTRNILSRNLLIMFYKALVESRLRYCNIVWGGMYNEHLKVVNIAQKQIIKTMFNLDRQYPTELLFSDSGLSTVRHLYILDCLRFVHQNLGFTTVGHSINTRSRTLNHMESCRCSSSSVQRFIDFLGPRFYNVLPQSIQTIRNKYVFKMKVREYVNHNLSIFLDQITILV